MNLKLILPTKKVNINGKEISIPKMGLKHQQLIKNEKDPTVAMQKIMRSIAPELNASENDFVSLHLLAFNGQIKNKKVDDGFEYNIDTLYISQRLEFQYAGKTFKFRAPEAFEEFGPVDDVLKTLYLSDDVQDWLDMPAFVSTWADDITNTVAIDGPHGPVRGLLQIMEKLK